MRWSYRYRKNPISARKADTVGDTRRAHGQKQLFGKKLGSYSLMLVLDAALLIVYVFLYSPLLVIDQLHISGGENVSEAVIQTLVRDYNKTLRFGIIPQTNLLAFSASSFKDYVSEQFDFEEISVQKKLFHTLTINVKEKSPFALFYSVDRKFLIEKNGFIAGEYTGDIGNEQAFQKIVEEVALGEPKVADQLVSPDTALFMQGFPAKLSGDAGLTFSEWTIPSRDSQRLHARVSDGWYIVFQMQKDLTQQYQNFLTIWNEKLAVNPPSEYVDVRITDRVFFK
ncbi:MAG: hypothetical protein A2898_04315 [Candidatus Kerfeldbacteria bacterium RIFCSPLOWO2_01_FULL_48_11]|uniref:POTRA domain-containing protein n=1 Tax=Candidatus Kerfeldbacteria bacterium RIFCSPLOWO2_01_FULL_48_11 TaxID=1798543 RepID=A0A1G2B3K6_9BACT|nr:MAG: hypothetical protein UY34_C0001G0067 [Parcubacteria group bacterium GW2011_GWA2_48_9]KKW16212.1 MAG: hypothetical protein UY52_C0008G0005 [Parcubacteria group bacterium GW2011_GWC2_49_9]OGY82790.1 MAG: hypothetical protein A2898_04315 [Candidatus Kerfeldbacteria bacterium RIFCSPLOWO2_01_FULL_48_11]HCJ52659.1 hypothetical protein [Candidatus Kerfeldbacteria bacterium]HCM68040.1 hypothetical protein [Candidatus Kerfeldbacteria bacterium]